MRQWQQKLRGSDVRVSHIRPQGSDGKPGDEWAWFVEVDHGWDFVRPRPLRNWCAAIIAEIDRREDAGT